MVDFENIRVEEAINHIRRRQEENRSRLEETNNLAMELIRLGRQREAKRLIDESVSGHLRLLARAEQCENCGDLEDAAELLWENIYVNGADSAVNFRKLMNVLRKLGCCEGELKVAEIFLHFTDRFVADEILARMKDVRKMQARI
jgi:hypothetical protein